MFSQTDHESCRLRSPPNRSATSSRANCPLRCPSPRPSSLSARPVTSSERCLPKRERDTHTHQQRPPSRRKAQRQVTGPNSTSSTSILTKPITLLQCVIFFFFFFLIFPSIIPTVSEVYHEAESRGRTRISLHEEKPAVYWSKWRVSVSNIHPAEKKLILIF